MASSFGERAPEFKVPVFLRILVRLQLLMITVSFQSVPRFKKNNSIHWFLSNGTVSQVSGLQKVFSQVFQIMHNVVNFLSSSGISEPRINSALLLLFSQIYYNPFSDPPLKLLLKEVLEPEPKEQVSQTAVTAVFTQSGFEFFCVDITSISKALIKQVNNCSDPPCCLIIGSEAFVPGFSSFLSQPPLQTLP